MDDIHEGGFGRESQTAKKVPPAPDRRRGTGPHTLFRKRVLYRRRPGLPGIPSARTASIQFLSSAGRPGEFLKYAAGKSPCAAAEFLAGLPFLPEHFAILLRI